jgi:hypothetical protein
VDDQDELRCVLCCGHLHLLDRHVSVLSAGSLGHAGRGLCTACSLDVAGPAGLEYWHPHTLQHSHSRTYATSAVAFTHTQCVPGAPAGMSLARLLLMGVVR